MVLSSLTYEVRRPPRWNTFFVGLVLEGVFLVVVAVLATHLGSSMRPASISTTHSVPLIAPSLEPKPAPRIVQAPPEIAKVEAPKIVPPPVVRETKPQPTPEPPRVVETPKPLPQAVTTSITPPKPKGPEIKTNVFDTPPKAATQPTAQVTKNVKTGGFGDPNGIAGQGDPQRKTVTLASVGSFDLPAGSGKSAGPSGAAGSVRAAGFSDGVTSNGVQVKQTASVAIGGFKNVEEGGSASAAKAVDKKPELQPVEITYKPRPTYTPEAIRKRIEGEVLLDVVFMASGSLRINRVVKGLGYGLDDMAKAAAEKIQFRPARRDGQPYDCAALVRMTFELAK